MRRCGFNYQKRFVYATHSEDIKSLKGIRTELKECGLYTETRIPNSS